LFAESGIRQYDEDLDPQKTQCTTDLLTLPAVCDSCEERGTVEERDLGDETVMGERGQDTDE